MNPNPLVHFKLLQTPDRVEGIARMLLQRNRLQPSVLILCPDDGFAAQLNERLWTIHPTSFLAHDIATQDQAHNAMQPILLSTSICWDNAPEVLINGTLEVPPALDKFKHIVDFVDGWDERLKQAARDRFRTYRQMSLDPQYFGNEKAS